MPLAFEVTLKLELEAGLIGAGVCFGACACGPRTPVTRVFHRLELRRGHSQHQNLIASCASLHTNPVNAINHTKCSEITTITTPSPCQDPNLIGGAPAKSYHSSPQGRIFQIEYASEAVKQGSVTVGLCSKSHVVLVALKVGAVFLPSDQRSPMLTPLSEMQKTSPHTRKRSSMSIPILASPSLASPPMPAFSQTS